jgi:putative lipoprotein
MRGKLLIATLLLAVAFAPPNAGAQARHPRARDSWFGADKIKHFFMSAFIESLTFSGLQAAGAHRNAAFAGAVGVTAAFGIGKEFHDRRLGELFSIRDLAWDAAGAGAAVVMLRSTQR